ncbi:GAF domain-containing protein [Streptomyces mirabilis]|uniref:GAF domain-containing protein n=1 Tax=Streptomyces mirabilis TaxID=68239 RepID=UPI00332AAB37
MQSLPPSENPVREVSAGLRTAAAVINAAAGAGEQVALPGTAGHAIGTTLDVCQTVQEMTAVLVPAMADYSTIDLLEPVLRGDDPPASGLEDRSVWRRAAVHGIDQGPLHALRDAVPELAAACPLCEPRLVVRLDHGDTWSRPKRPGDADLGRLGLHSMMVVPLVTRGQVLGLVTVYRGRQRASFSQADLRIATHIAAFAALALDNARNSGPRAAGWGPRPDPRASWPCHRPWHCHGRRLTPVNRSGSRRPRQGCAMRRRIVGAGPRRVVGRPPRGRKSAKYQRSGGCCEYRRPAWPQPALA